MCRCGPREHTEWDAAPLACLTEKECMRGDGDNGGVDIGNKCGGMRGVILQVLQNGVYYEDDAKNDNIYTYPSLALSKGAA